MRRPFRVLTLLAGGLAFASPALVASRLSADDEPPPAVAPAHPPAGQEDLERDFAKLMSGATLAGHFTIGPLAADKAAKSPSQPLKEDRYTLGKVEKLKGDQWLIEARIQYGDHDLTVPLILDVKWAGDTPVISLTDLTVPGLGTFSARVLVYRGQYAGTWRHGDRGGELFGRVEPAKK